MGIPPCGCRGSYINNNVTTDLFVTILEENMEYIEKLIGQARSWYGHLEKKSNRDLDNFTANAGNKNYTCFPWDYKLHTGQNVILRRGFFYAESEEHIW
jgi:hypothetical protein|nr:MAG TPA: hypothetical protein [Caudoviricetes sp.]